MSVFGVLSQLYENILLQACTRFTNEQIEIIVTPKLVAMAMPHEVKDTYFGPFEANNSKTTW